MKRVLLIIPAYNEEDNILDTVNQITKYSKKIDYIIINDGSKDETGEVCRKNRLEHVDLVRNLGIGGAVQTGYKYALENGYDFAVQFDGDGQHDVRYVSNIVEPLLNDHYDMVIGSRFIEEKSQFRSTKMRQVVIKLISVCIKLVTRQKIYDPTSGFRACNREVIKIFADSYPTEYPEPISTCLLLKNGYKVKEIAVEMNKRNNGYSSISSWRNAYYLVNVLMSILLVGFWRKK